MFVYIYIYRTQGIWYICIYMYIYKYTHIYRYIYTGMYTKNDMMTRLHKRSIKALLRQN